METVVVQPPGAGEPLTLAVEWREAADGLAGFTLEAGETTLSGAGELGHGGEGVLRFGERVLPFYVARSDGALDIWLAGEVYRFTLPKPAARGTSRKLSGPPSTGEVTAPMPGLVRKVLVRAGDEVAAQAPVIVLESMKMELSLAAPVAGKVAEVLCEEGQLVDMGAVLLRVQPTAAD